MPVLSSSFPLFIPLLPWVRPHLCATGDYPGVQLKVGLRLEVLWRLKLVRLPQQTGCATMPHHSEVCAHALASPSSTLCVRGQEREIDSSLSNMLMAEKNGNVCKIHPISRLI